MLDETELVIRPIVQESVQHNARVSAPFVISLHLSHLPGSNAAYLLLNANMHFATDGLEHARTHSVALRCRRRDLGFGILAWFHLLHLWHGNRFHPYLRSESGE